MLERQPLLYTMNSQMVYHLVQYFKRYDVSQLRQMLDARTLRRTFEEDEDAFYDLQELMFQQLFNAVPFYQVVQDLEDYCREEEPETEEEEEEEDY